VGSLSVNGLSGNEPGNRTYALLEFLRLQDRSLQQQVSILGIGSAIILVSKSVLSFYLSKKTMLFLARRAAIISKQLISDFLKKQILTVQKQSLQETIFAITAGVNILTAVIIGATLLLMADVFLIIAFSVSLFIVDFAIAVSSLLIFGLTGLVLFFIQNKEARRLGEVATKLEISSANKISDVVRCYRELVVKHRRAYYADEIGSLRLGVAEAGAKLSVMGLMSKYIIEVTMVVGALLVGAIQFLTESSSRAVDVISIFLLTSTRIAPAVLRIQTSVISIRNSISMARPTIELIHEGVWSEQLKSEDEVEEFAVSEIEHLGFKASVQIDNVSFRYPGKKKNAIDSFSLDISEGQLIGIVGRSGAGKTTLIDLFLGILNPDIGEIRISNCSPSSAYAKWPGAVAYVPQETNLVNGSIKENICLGFNPSLVPDSYIERLLRDVQLVELLSLPQGINSPVGDRGSKLSGGQRQRIGLARALFTQPRLLILDEATSSLDSITESKITSLLNQKKGFLTIIVIAHRLSTIRTADKIVFLDAGRVLGIGRFDQLRKSVPQFDLQAKTMGL
jgi:ABC-type multidrug transport system fused ATPase/permease subunit